MTPHFRCGGARQPGSFQLPIGKCPSHYLECQKYVVACGIAESRLCHNCAKGALLQPHDGEPNRGAVGSSFERLIVIITYTWREY